VSRTFALVLVPSLIVATVAGCTVYPSLEPPRVMDFSAESPVPKATRTHAFSLRIDTPYASDPLGSNKILAKPTPLEFRIYDGVRWRDTAPVVVRDLLVTSFREAGAFNSVISDTNPADADWTLVSELTAFHTEINVGEVHATIELHGQLVDNRSRKTLCAASFVAREEADNNLIEPVVEAFSAAGKTLSVAVVNWAGDCHQPES